MLREDAALEVTALDPLEPDGVRRRAPVELALEREVAHMAEGALHAALEAGLDLFEVPTLRALVLQPLVVGDDDAARVREDVGDEIDTALLEHLLGLGVRRPVRALDDDLDLERLGLGDAELELERGRDEDVRLHREELVARD